MNYSEYKIEDWVTDDAFIEYVNGAASQDMDRLMKDSNHTANMEEASRIVRTISSKKVIVSDQKLEDIFVKINTTVGQPARPRAKIVNMKWVGIAAAAVTVLMIALPFFKASENRHITTVAEQEMFQLPDSSLVHLNSVSSVRYNNKSWSKNRYLLLEGEAFFEVKKGSNFMVKSPQGIVTVLGTQFNIRDRIGFYEVECLEGKVQVALKNGETHILERGDKLSQTNKQQPVIKKNVVKTIDWLDRYVEVKGQSISSVLEEVSRHFEVKFVNSDSIANELYTGFFSTVSLDSAMHQILWPMNVEYEIKDKKVIIK